MFNSFHLKRSAFMQSSWPPTVPCAGVNIQSLFLPAQKGSETLPTSQWLFSFLNHDYIYFIFLDYLFNGEIFSRLPQAFDIPRYYLHEGTSCDLCPSTLLDCTKFGSLSSPASRVSFEFLSVLRVGLFFLM